jgi:hypothetical protein
MQRSGQVQPYSERTASMNQGGMGSLQVSSRVRNFLVQMCDSCEKPISVDAGDVVQGDRWYHDSCLKNKEGTDSKPPVGPLTTYVE